MSPKSTRLRFISSVDADAISQAISRLPFKVELKGVEWNGKRWVAWFVLPEEDQLDFRNLEL